MHISKKTQDKPCGDQSEVLNSQEYSEIYLALSEKKKSSNILKYLMNKFENYRQKKKIGWSRPQNKIHVNTFESFYLRPNHDVDLIDTMKKIVQKSVKLTGPKELDSFLSIINDSELMGFMFVQDYDDGLEQKEIITISLGRKCKTNRRYRDRVDFLFESKVIDERAQGINSLKIFIDPFEPTRLADPLWQGTCKASFDPEVIGAYDIVLRKYYDIRQDESRRWNHWTQDYIDYFGPRKRPILNSFVGQIGVTKQ
ncbi:MAG: hypothetical protein AB8G05_11645 [Oligoflexales bacterium]